MCGEEGRWERGEREKIRNMDDSHDTKKAYNEGDGMLKKIDLLMD